MASGFRLIRGDTTDITITVIDQANGLPADLTGAKLWLTAKRSTVEPDSAAVFQLTSALGGGIVLTNPTGGIATATVLPAMTVNLEGTLVTLAYDVQIKLVNGRILTIDHGTFVVEPDVTITTT